jgi:hypothetical protein
MLIINNNINNNKILQSNRLGNLCSITSFKYKTIVRNFSISTSCLITADTEPYDFGNGHGWV